MNNNEIKFAGQKVINYLTKHKCHIVWFYRYGIRVYRIFKNGCEKTYPKISEDIYCEIREHLDKVKPYDTGYMFKLKPTLYSTPNKVHGNTGNFSTREALLAMQEYADQEMAAFAEWVNTSPFIKVDKLWTHFENIDNDGKLIKKSLRITTQQLIQKYKEEHGEK